MNIYEETKNVVEQFSKDVTRGKAHAVTKRIWNEKEQCFDSVVIPTDSYMVETGVWRFGDKEYVFNYWKPSDKNVIEWEDWYVDKETGEILGEINPKKSKHKSTYITPFKDFSCEDDLRDWALSNGLKQTMELHCDTFLWEDLVDTTPLLLLIRDVKYVNVGFYTREHLCGVFNTNDKSLVRKLKQYAKTGAFVYETKGLFKKGEVRITFNPTLCFRGPEDWQQSFQRSWVEYRRKQIEKDESQPNASDKLVPSKEWFENLKNYTQEDIAPFLERADFDSADEMYETFIREDEEVGQEVEVLNKVVEEHTGVPCGSKEKVLSCSDVDFKLFVRGAVDVNDLRKL